MDYSVAGETEGRLVGRAGGRGGEHRRRKGEGQEAGRWGRRTRLC